jgi:hypothetical protein
MVWRAKKRQKLDELAANEALAGSSNTNAIPESGLVMDSVPTAVVQNDVVSSYSNTFPWYVEYSIFNQSPVSSPMDVDRSIAERRVR